MMAQKAPARACLLIPLLAHGVFGATSASEDTVLVQLNTNATMGDLAGVDSLKAAYSGYGPQLVGWCYDGVNNQHVDRWNCDGRTEAQCADLCTSMSCAGFAYDDNGLCAPHPADYDNLDPAPAQCTYAQSGGGRTTVVTTSDLQPAGTSNNRCFIKSTPEPTAVPTPAPTVAPTSDVASGVGDPHLSNIHGEHFDIYQTGKMALLHLPRLAEPARTMLLVEADARNMGDVCSVYFQVVTISGEWTNQTKPIQFLANTHGTPVGRHWKEWMRFGPIDLKVALRNKGVDYLNVYARNIGHTGYEVGGLLGLDDHTAVAKRPRQCANRHASALFSVAEAN